jgi:hypothetical protein
MEMAAVHRVQSLNAVPLGRTAARTVTFVSIKAGPAVVLAVLAIHPCRIAAKA